MKFCHQCWRKADKELYPVDGRRPWYNKQNGGCKFKITVGFVTTGLTRHKMLSYWKQML